MAQQTLKKLKYNGSEIIVEAAYRDGLGRTISDTYLTSVAWSGVTSKPFTSVDSGSGKDFTIDSNVLKLNHTQLATKYVELSTYNTMVNGLSTNYQAKHANLTSISGLSTSSTGLIKMTNGTASLDTNTYATTSAVANGYQPLDADLTAIAALTGTSGLLKKTAANTWSLDTNTYATQTWVTDKGYQTSSQVSTAIQTALSGWHTFAYETATSLPTASASTMYKIYLVPASNSADNNVKNEFITIDNGSSADPRYTWEQIGSTVMDLSGYVKKYTFNTDTALSAAETTFPVSQAFILVPENMHGSYAYYVYVKKEANGPNSYYYDVEMNSALGDAVYHLSTSDGTKTFAEVLNNNFINVTHQYDPNNTWGSTSGKIIVSAATSHRVNPSSYSIDSSTTTVSNTSNVIPLSKAVYAELGKKQNNLTFSTGLTNSSNTVTLNTATADALGGIKIGTGLSVSSGVVSVSSAPTAAAWSGNPFTVTDVTLDY